MAKKLIDLNENTSLKLGKCNAFAIGLKELIAPNPGAIYQVELKYRKAYSLYSCGGSASHNMDTKDLIENYDEAVNSSFWDSSQYYKGNRQKPNRVY